MEKQRNFLIYQKLFLLGGSIINHGGQNPIEPARFGLNICMDPTFKILRIFTTYLTN